VEVAEFGGEPDAEAYGITPGGDPALPGAATADPGQLDPSLVPGAEPPAVKEEPQVLTDSWIEDVTAGAPKQ
jgi:penicillin-binding protein 1A